MCELPRVAHTGTPQTLGGSASGGLSRGHPSSPRPQAQTAGLGSSQARDWLLSGRILQTGLWVFLASDSLQTQDEGRRTVIFSDSGIFSVRVVVAGGPLLLPSREGPARSPRLTLHLPVSSHSRTKFSCFSLHWTS